MTNVPATNEARSLLLAQADRTLTGRIEDPAVLAAVVSIERLVVATGSTVPDLLRAAVEGRLEGSGPGSHVADLAAQAHRHVAAGLARRSSGQSIDAAVVNPEAGAYPVTTDATLVRAAVRAAQRSIDAMPYYGLRYGERGARFASSDSAWLISLAPLGTERAIQQVTWLSRVLAGRGMPSWLMELHLTELVAEVRAATHDDAVGSLPAAAEALTLARRQHVDDDLISLADTWAGHLAGDGLPVPRTGALVAAATADVLLGVTDDDHALMDWLTDPDRVGAKVSAAIHQVRDRVRLHAG
ncbi:hypothetical protein ABEG17_16615 [Pedococcus sp. KACC 23699]|uniref:Uncharacterized protein n=1 Tax=Pedococcus sp. KACC 23699 TaxID=3149228 RepID=A0AAU7JSF5_9MICO